VSVRVTASPLDRLTATPFVGRTEILGHLRDAVDRAAGAQGSCILLCGEPGVGKTRTAAEVLAYARDRGFEVLDGASHEDEGAPAYWPLIRALRAWAARREPMRLRSEAGDGIGPLATLLPELRALFPDVPEPPRLDAASARFRLMEAVAASLEATSRVQPVVLLLEDLHWADLATLRLVRFLAERARAERVLLLGSYRDAEARTDAARSAALGEIARHAETIRLGGLAEAEVARFLEAIVGSASAPELVAALHRRTGGNPLFVIEIVRLLASEGRLERATAEDVASARVPAGVEHTIAKRVARLSPACRLVLAAAAVAGVEFKAAVLASLVPSLGQGLAARRAVGEALMEAGKACLVLVDDSGPGHYRFAHALIRDTLYERLAERDRLDLHKALAEALERRAEQGESVPNVDLAHHFFKASSAGTAEKAFRYAMLAGEEALGHWAHEEAVESFARALAALDEVAPDDGVRRCDALLALGTAQARAGENAAARESFTQAAALARRRGAAEELARAALGHPLETGVDMTAGFVDAHAADLLEEALRALGKEESPLRVRVLARLSACHRDRDRRSSEAVEVARRLGDPATLGTALVERYWCLWGPAWTEQRLAIANEVVALADRLADKELAFHGHTLRATNFLQLGDRAGADHALDVQRELTRDLRQPRYRWNSLVGDALRAFLDGDLERSERLASEALAVGQHAEAATAVRGFAGQLAMIRREQGRLAELEPAVAAAVARQPQVTAFRCNLAWVMVELGRLDEARGHLDHLAAAKFTDLPDDGLLEFCLANLAEVAVALADRPRAERLYDLLLPYAERQLMLAGALALGPAARLLGGLAALLDRAEEASAHFERALVLAARMRAIPCLAWTRLDYARMLAGRDGERERARGLLDEARAAAHEHGLVRLLEEAAKVEDDSRLSPASEPAERADRRALAARGSMRRAGEYWELGWDGRLIRLRDLKGLRYLAQLLGDPGRELHVLDLVALCDGIPAPEGAAGEPGLSVRAMKRVPRDAGVDAAARDAYRARLRELASDLDEAEAHRDAGRVARLRAEQEAIRSELAGVYEVGRASRRPAGSSVEKARKAVYNRLRSAIARIDHVHPRLGRHLGATVRSGTLCVYFPDPPARWRVEI
jgi:tetratricopeptide (TPR) repeat protein